MHSWSIRRLVVAAACLTLLSGCMAFVLSSLEPDQRAGLFLVSADKAVIYFYRDASGADAAPVVLSIDGSTAGQPGADGLFYREVDPGEHTVTLLGADYNNITLTVEAGRTYFIVQDVECAPAGRHPYLHPANQSAGRARVRALIAARKAPPAEDARMEADSSQCAPAAESTTL